jgi:lipopolysaccharide assembly outer membrane protein LptD (OstA)
MKLVMLGIALMACLPAFPQDQPAASHRYEVFRTRDGFRFVWDDGSLLEVKATTMESVKELPGVRFKGMVEIKIDGVTLQADEVDYHLDTGEFEPYGNVHLKPNAK